MAVLPIKPDEVGEAKARLFPDAVIEAFNELIAQKFANGSAKFNQDDVIGLMVKKGLKRGEIFKNNWLDVELLYRSVGWVVEYDKPDFNGTGDSSFVFRRPAKR